MPSPVPETLIVNDPPPIDLQIIVDYEYDSVLANKTTLRQAIAVANTSTLNVEIVFAQSLKFIYISTPIDIIKSAGRLSIDGLVSGQALLSILKSSVRLGQIYILVI